MKKVVKVITVPKTDGNINLLEEDAEKENQLVDPDDPDEMTALESIKEDFDDGKLHTCVVTVVEFHSKAGEFQ